MKIIDLFSGIGGFSLAAHWIGWETALFCEKEPFCRDVLKKNFPNVPIHDDINTLTKERFLQLVPDYNANESILTAGFPCQPFSRTGKKKGKSDERYLWPTLMEVIQSVCPRFFLLENVDDLAKMENGSILEGIYADMEGEGYEVHPSVILPDASVEAWHRRDRIWIFGNKKTNTNDHKIRTQGIRKEKIQRQRRISRSKNVRIHEAWRRSPDLFAPILCGSNDGVPDRVDRTKALGNSIVPQVAFEIFVVLKKFIESQDLEV